MADILTCTTDAAISQFLITGGLSGLPCLLHVLCERISCPGHILTVGKARWYNFSMLRRQLAYTFLLIFSFSCAGIVSASAPAKPVDDLRKTVLALDSAWTRALSDLQQKKRDGVLQSDEKQDYAKFIAFLSGRITEYCRQLRIEGGEQAVTDLPCPDGTSFNSEGENSFTPSKAEQVAELDKSLTEALGEFDQQLLREEQRIASRTPAERESGSGYRVAGGSGMGEQTGTGRYGGGGPAGSGGQSGTGGQASSGNTGSGSQAGSQGSGPNNSGGSQSGHGPQASAGGAGAGTGHPASSHQQPGQQQIEEGYDDIVARQLREAAEKETDPELKKKLWEEYRKYKEGIR